MGPFDGASISQKDAIEVQTREEKNGFSELQKSMESSVAEESEVDKRDESTTGINLDIGYLGESN